MRFTSRFFSSLLTVVSIFISPTLAFAETSFEHFQKTFYSSPQTEQKKQELQSASSSEIPCEVLSSFETCLNAVINNQVESIYFLFSIHSKNELLQILAALKTNTSVKKMDYRDDHIGVSVFENGRHDMDIMMALTDLLKYNRGLKDVVIQTNRMDTQTLESELIFAPEDINQITNALAVNSTITGFGLTSLTNGSYQFYKSVINLKYQTPKIKDFYIGINSSAFNGGFENDIEGLSNIIFSLSNLPIENFGFMSYAYSDASSDKINSALNYLLENNNAIKGLSIESHGFRYSAGKQFSKALQKNTSLNSIAFVSSEFRGALGLYSIDNMIEALKSSKIKDVYMSYFPCYLNDLEQLLDYVKTGSLKSFHMIYYRDDFPAANLQDILNIICENKTLEKFFIEYAFSASDEYAQLLANALKQNNTLKNVSFLYDNFSQNGASILASSLENNFTIIEFLGHWDWLSPQEKAVFEARLERNRHLPPVH